MSSEDLSAFTANKSAGHWGGQTKIRWSRDFLDGRYASGETLQLCQFADEYDLDLGSALTAFADLHTLGMGHTNPIELRHRLLPLSKAALTRVPLWHSGRRARSARV